MKLLAIAVLLLGSQVVSAAPKKYDTESDVVLDKTHFTISAGWSFDDAKAELVSPEGDMVVYFSERPFKQDIEALSRDAWKTIDPTFSLEVRRKVSPPPKDGWEQAHQIVYATPARENRTVLTLIHVFQGTAYLLLLDSSKAGLSKRGAQVQIVADTWRPPHLKKEDLSHNKIKIFTQDDAAQFDGFIANAIDQLAVPGMSVAIVQNDRVVYRRAFGVKQLGKSDQVTPQTLFMIGSTTKPLTTLMLAKLIEEGKLTWTRRSKRRCRRLRWPIRTYRPSSW